MHSHCEQWSTFNLRKLPFPLILPIYVASKDFLELMVRLDKILISTTVKKNIIVVYCFSRWSLFFFCKEQQKYSILKLTTVLKVGLYLCNQDASQEWSNTGLKMVHLTHFSGN